jgi:hypothetical protein
MAALTRGHNLPGIREIPIVLQLIANCGGDNINVEERRGHHGAAVVAAHLPE